MVVHFVFVAGAAYLLFQAIKRTIGLRVSEEEELEGLDVMEHGAPGYGHEPGVPSLTGTTGMGSPSPGMAPTNQ